MSKTPWRPLGRALGAALLGAALFTTGAGTAAATPVRAASAAPAVQAAAAAAPKITKQPVAATQVAGKAVKFSVTATGDNLRYAWQLLEPGSNKWQAVEHTTSAFSMFAKTNRHGWKFRVVVSNSAGSVTSTAVTLNVLSTFADPVALNRWTRLQAWEVASVNSSPAGTAWPSIKKANRFNDAPPSGYDYVQTRFKVRHVNTGKLDPAYTLDFSFMTNDGKTYKAAPVITSDDLFDVGPLSRQKEDTFTVAVAVPKNKIASGSWVVTDYVDYKNRQLAYFTD